MENDFKKLLRYNDRVFWVDLTTWETGGDAVISVINPDGSSRNATSEDADLFELLRDGMVIGDSPVYPSIL